MSTKDFTANVISASKVVPDGNFKDSKASGIWDINEALDLIKGGNWPNVANVNPAAFVDALFQTHLYTGTQADLTITNNIDLSGKGGLVWTKGRDYSGNHHLFDTERGVTKRLRTNTNAAESSNSEYLKTFNSDGFTIGNAGNNSNTQTHVSWTWRKQPKFFDVVTYTGTGSARTVAHNLGSVPGMIIVKQTTGTKEWRIYHRGSDGSAPEDYYISLNSSNSRIDDADTWNDTAPTSSVFTVGGGSVTNQDGETFVAYLFAHHDDDGGFGAAGDQDIIKCGSYLGNGGASQEIDLGFECGWLLVKNVTDNSTDWIIFDKMRHFVRPIAQSGDSDALYPNSTAAESGIGRVFPTSKGFAFEQETGGSLNAGNKTYIFVAIRRGGMQTPTAASSVFSIDTIGSGAPFFDSNHVVDMALVKSAGADGDWYNYARIMGQKYITTNRSNAEASASEAEFDFMKGHLQSDFNGSSELSWMWKQARGYFDISTYAGTGSAQNISHNLGVTPEMFWVKRRDSSGGWYVYHKGIDVNGDNSPETDRIQLDASDAAADSASFWDDTAPTATAFRVNSANAINASGGTFIAYLFATVAGVSKVGSYTGNDGSTNVDCGFTNGASFVLIKKIDGTGDWFIFDSTRGIVAGNTPSLKLNTDEAEDELGARDIIDPLAAGFTVNANRGGVNDNGDTFLFYAIASIA